MEENNDFEKYDGDENPSETLPETNEKSPSMSSRERVDSAVEDAGSEVLSKVGVPKGLAKKAVKSNGGKFSPTNYGVNKLAKNVTRNKVAKGLDKMDNLKNKNESNKNKIGDRINKIKEKGNLFSSRKVGKSPNEEEGKVKENTEKKSGLSKLSNGKKSNGSGRSKLATAAHIAKNPKKAAAEAIVNIAKNVWEKNKKKILLGIVAVAVAIFIVPLFIFEVIMGPLMEAWGQIDEAITGVADFSEKVTNFYYGFGFQDSKEAFYDELNDLCDKYTCSNDGTGLDVPMVLATLFYTEGMGYNTSYDNIEDESVIDETMSGSTSGAFSSIREWLREKYDATKETVDENGLTYNAGKIYRLRKLARNQFYTNAFGLTSKKGPVETVSLGKFITMYGKNVATDIKNMISDLANVSVSIFTPFKEIYAWAIGSKYAGDYFTNLADRAGDFGSTFKTLISDVFYGLVDITDIDLKIGGDDGLLTVNISYRKFTYDEDNYKKYLMNYYFEQMPEYSSMLNGLSGGAREEKKEYLFNQINDNKKLFESVFLKYQQESSENYTDSCVGAVDQSLVPELNMPVDIADNATISFDDNYSYGIVDGKTHNGVDFNESTAGVKLGANVYTVANGKIESIEDSKCTDDSKKCGKSIKIKHNIIIDNDEYNFFTIYSNVTPKSDLKKGASVSKGDTIGTIYNNADNTEGLHFVFMDANTDKKGTAIDPTNIFIKCSQGGVFSGSNNEEAVWNYLLGFGYPKNAVAGMMGNMSVESGSTFDGRIVQGDREPITFSIDYTNKVDSGAISKNDFVNNGPNGGGYGIVQWTYYTLKDGLYEYAKTERKITIGDTAMQLDYLDKYLQSDKKDLYNSLKDPNISIDSATRAFMIQFENPRYKEESDQVYRVQISQDIYNRHATSN